MSMSKLFRFFSNLPLISMGTATNQDNHTSTHHVLLNKSYFFFKTFSLTTNLIFFPHSSHASPKLAFLVLITEYSKRPFNSSLTPVPTSNNFATHAHDHVIIATRHQRIASYQPTVGGTVTYSSMLRQGRATVLLNASTNSTAHLQRNSDRQIK